MFNHFLLIDATGQSKLSSDRYQIQFYISLYFLSFFANTPLNKLSFVNFFIKSLFQDEVSLSLAEHLRKDPQILQFFKPRTETNFNPENKILVLRIQTIK